MKIIKNKVITSVSKKDDDGISLFDGDNYLIENCIIDLSNCDLDYIDESIGVTWGSSATMKHCIIKGAGKLFLVGSGDEDKVEIESYKVVNINDCILEDFSRRGPEVQDYMIVNMNRCLIRNWGEESRFSVRSFASWSHNGGRIIASDCVYFQPYFWRGLKQMFLDFIGHFGQAFNDDGLSGILDFRTYIPGVCRALISTCYGEAKANHCGKNKWWIYIQNNKDEMSKKEVSASLIHFSELENDIKQKLDVE